MANKQDMMIIIALTTQTKVYPGQMVFMSVPNVVFRIMSVSIGVAIKILTKFTCFESKNEKAWDDECVMKI